jgi:hypothetical protein
MAPPDRAKANSSGVAALCPRSADHVSCRTAPRQVIGFREHDRAELSWHVTRIEYIVAAVLLMINTPEPSRRKTERALRWLSTSRDDARARTASMAPRVRQSPPLAPLSNSKSPSLAIVDAHNTRHRRPSDCPHTYAVPFKSPYRRRASAALLRRPNRGVLPWRISDAGHRSSWLRLSQPASEMLHSCGPCRSSLRKP